MGYLLLLWMVGSLGAVAEPATPEVQRVSFAERQDGDGYVVRIHTSGTINAYSAPNYQGDQVELVLFNTRLASPCQLDEGQGPVTSYEATEEHGHLYLRFQLQDNVSVTTEAYRDRRSDDMLVAFSTTARSEPPAVPIAQVAAPDAQVHAPAAQPSEAPGASQSARDRWTLDTIVIDAGHGGHDPGTIGAGGIREKDVVLPVAKKLGAYLEELLGVNVVYTREDDRFIDLKDRGRMANEAGGKLFISIHVNAAENASARGAEVYFLGMHKSQAAHNVMERENSVVQLETNPEHYANFDRQSLILQTLTQSAYMRKSEELAELIMDDFAGRAQRKTRGVKQAGFYVLFGASMPAVLVELGFLSNPGEAAYLRSEQGQTYLASAIFRAVRAFKEKYDRDLHIANQNQAN